MEDDGSGFVGVVPEGIAALASALSDLHNVLTQNASTLSVTMQEWESILGQGPWTPSDFASLAIDRQRWVYDQAAAMKRRSDLAQELEKQTVHGFNTGTVYVNGMPQCVGGALVTLPFGTDDPAYSSEAAQDAARLKDAIDHPDKSLSMDAIKQIGQILDDHLDDPAFLQSFYGSGGADAVYQLPAVIRAWDDDKYMGKDLNLTLDGRQIIAPYAAGLAAWTKAAGQGMCLQLPPDLFDASKGSANSTAIPSWSIEQLLAVGPSGDQWDPTYLSAIGTKALAYDDAMQKIATGNGWQPQSWASEALKRIGENPTALLQLFTGPAGATNAKIAAADPGAPWQGGSGLSQAVVDASNAATGTSSGNAEAVLNVFSSLNSGASGAGADPAVVKKWWNGLDPQVQKKLIADHSDIVGSLDGIPSALRDTVNRHLLDADIAQLQQDGSDPKQLATLEHLRESMNASGPVWRTDDHTQKWGADHYTALMPPLLLLHFDAVGNGHLIMAAGDPDVAKNVVTYVPGLGTTLSDHMINNDIPHTENLYLQALQDHPDASVSSIFWLGYNAPVIGGGSTGLSHTFDVAGDSDAKDGDAAFTRFLNSLHATSTADGPVHYTALGHSYGSLVVGTAAARPGGIPVDDIVLIGSPGVDASHAAQLNIDPSHVWAGDAANDPVPRLNDAASALELGLPIVGAYWSYLDNHNADGASFGVNPVSSSFGANVFRVADGDTGGQIPGVDAHGEYFDPAKRGPDGLGDDSSLKNLGNIIVGDYGNVRAR